MLPDTLVKLASFGTSGVCILIVFWCGHTISKLGSDTPKPVFQLFRHYLLLCAFIAVISALTGFAVARNTEADTRELIKALKESQDTFQQLKARADAVSAQIEAARAATPNQPPTLPPDTIRAVSKASSDVSNEAEKAAQNAKKATQWISKRTGLGIKW